MTAENGKSSAADARMPAESVRDSRVAKKGSVRRSGGSAMTRAVGGRSVGNGKIPVDENSRSPRRATALLGMTTGESVAETGGIVGHALRRVAVVGNGKIVGVTTGNPHPSRVALRMGHPGGSRFARTSDHGVRKGFPKGRNVGRRNTWITSPSGLRES
jgi:hypothetical protein